MNRRNQGVQNFLILRHEIWHNQNFVNLENATTPLPGFPSLPVSAETPPICFWSGVVVVGELINPVGDFRKIRANQFKQHYWPMDFHLATATIKNLKILLRSYEIESLMLKYRSLRTH